MKQTSNIKNNSVKQDNNYKFNEITNFYLPRTLIIIASLIIIYLAKANLPQSIIIMYLPLMALEVYLDKSFIIPKQLILLIWLTTLLIARTYFPIYTIIGGLLFIIIFTIYLLVSFTMVFNLKEWSNQAKVFEFMRPIINWSIIILFVVFAIWLGKTILH